jgi:hypothetical protein
MVPPVWVDESGQSHPVRRRPNVQPPIVRSAITGWRDAVQAIGNMPVPARVAPFLIMLAFSAGSFLLVTNLNATGRQPGPELVGLTLALRIVVTFLVTPVAIAVHRFVLLGEVPGRYALNPSDPRFRRFFGFAAALNLIGAIWLVSAIPTKQELGPATSTTLAFTLLMLLVVIVVVPITMIVSVRTVILFPAIAIDAADASWRNAMRDSKGHSWRVFFILFATALPALVPTFLLAKLAGAGAIVWTGMILIVVEAILGGLTICAVAAVASRLYQAFATSLGRPPSLA